MAVNVEREFYGAGPVGPVQRTGKGDFAFGSGAQLMLSNFRQLLEIKRGELPWNRRLGSRLHLMQHKSNDDYLAELGRVLIEEAVEADPRFRVDEVIPLRELAARPYTLVLRVRFSVVTVPGGVPVLTGLETAIPLE